MPDKVRYGLISTARIGFTAHVPGAATSENSEIVAVSSRNLASAEAAAKEHNIPLAFGSYQEMIDSDEIDAVINTLPNSMHHEWTIKAAQAGKHVLCEKPLSATMDEAREMKAVAEENNVVLVEAFTPRWNKQLVTVRSLIADGEIGDVIRLDGAEAGITWRDVPISWAEEMLLQSGEFLTVTLEFGNFGANPMHVKRQHTAFGGAPDPFIHPVLRHWKDGQLLASTHLSDHLDSDWRDPAKRDPGTVLRMTYADQGQTLPPSEAAFRQLTAFLDQIGISNSETNVTAAE